MNFNRTDYFFNKKFPILNEFINNINYILIRSSFDIGKSSEILSPNLLEILIHPTKLSRNLICWLSLSLLSINEDVGIMIYALVNLLNSSLLRNGFSFSSYFSIIESIKAAFLTQKFLNNGLSCDSDIL